ncbi:hypothetical protein CANCADRAFT_3319 [Tortispora caseinolytica NRRL Y-17796]|uniref:Riboflavin synthase n=1 Tax=Tortispora caseinolytica NRRL Y-17796 TaxID=767744 RepID=A0A1E4TA89_9ASCO|nr:hypothetical protein CANCADRAFT_3319 [Tortispora caseinolytica NRRL Y-17796]
MFTGIVEKIGTVKSVNRLDGHLELTITDIGGLAADANLGDSIAVNGTCLTITYFDPSTFTFGIAPETLRRTTLGSLQPGDHVNLERAVTSEVRLGGHLVQGHIDGYAKVTARTADGDAIAFTFQILPLEDPDVEDSGPEIIRYIVQKGFICVDGTSLTVTGVDYDTATFSVMIVPYTQSQVIMPERNVGDLVNIEVDVTGKLVSKQVDVYLQAPRTKKLLDEAVAAAVDRALKARSL